MPSITSLEQQARVVERDLRDHVLDRGRLAVVQAPPGSGKTWLLLKTVESAFKNKLRVAIATQTNAQANDICERIVRDYPRMPAVRFASGGATEHAFGGNVQWVTKTDDLPDGPSVVVATAAKWGLVTVGECFDVLFVEEAWQLSWADFMLLGQVAERFVLIGDPGQIAPVVSIEVARWETSPRPPHLAAPRVIIDDPRLKPERFNLPATRRLPHDTAALVQPFYDFPFGAFAAPGSRAVLCTDGRRRTAVDRAIDALGDGSVVALTVPTPDTGPPIEYDDELAKVAANVVARLLDREARARIDGGTAALTPADIGMVATHRVMNAAIEGALPRKLRGAVRVDTPERWQGLERKVMVAVHPLSGVMRPSAFDLATGRLCVMASRHKAGLVVVARDHVAETLRDFIPTADQPVGRPDAAGRGLQDNLVLWDTLARGGRIFAT